ncbi:uncharacterized protein BXIN_0473 [Babesia sp. Xinjiang]|uniref:uncharacterized protein n=1 Tax=Babesia sp. Xinjiang TaxID=462227 RepID=UPI000A258C11|nr:uncharacterized protein BXIN_0473 [Babesia sp. Xinjiang]ORM41920.1 hypothetical protein BXIN_0473 [Babesia sp. Xinjiang]
MAECRRPQSHTVEEAIAFVSGKFADMENDLALVEKKLIAEMSSIYGNDIFELHSRCQDLKKQVKKITSDLAELYNARQQLVNVIENQLQQSASLKNIEKLLDPNKVDEDTQLMEMLGSHYKGIWYDVETDVEEPEEVETVKILTPLSLIGSLEITPTKVEAPPPEPEFKPVSQKQYDNVPSLVKRRAKLEQVNELYLFLFKMAVERKRSLPIKLKEISQGGIQVFGQTGSSKIAALRYLKIVELNNRDETVTLLDDRFQDTHQKRKRTRHN